MMTLIASALAGGDCIDDPDVFRTGGEPAPWAAQSRRYPPWRPSCAASGGTVSVSWIGWAGSCRSGGGFLTTDLDFTICAGQGGD